MFKITNSIRLLASVMVLLCCLTRIKCQEQSDKSTIAIGGDFTTRFFWRGMNLSTSPAFQPYLEVSKGAFTIGSWGSYSFAKEPHQEIDVYLSYEYHNARVTIYDYFSPVDSIGVAHQYFDWGRNTTKHTVEVIGEWWDIGGSLFSIEAGVFVYGDDKDVNENPAYSIYLEPRYNFSVGDNQVRVFSGLTPKAGLYAPKAAIVNVGVVVERQVVLGDMLSFPVAVTFAVNPYSESVFMVASLSL